MTQAHIEHSIQVSPQPHSASVTQIETNKLLPWLMVSSLLAGFSCALATFAIVAAQRAERESRMYQYYTLEMDAKLIASGVKKPEDAVSKRVER